MLIITENTITLIKFVFSSTLLSFFIGFLCNIVFISSFFVILPYNWMGEYLLMHIMADDKTQQEVQF